jgi:hypothetical protein
VKLIDWALAAAATTVGIALAVWIGDRKSAAGDADSIRKCVVETAKAQLGKAELERYFAAVAPDFVGQRPEWCGIFALWVLNQCGLAPGVKWIVAKGFMFRLPRTTDPKPGDMAYFTKFNHQAVVVGVRGDEIDLINGNGAGGVVSASTKQRGDAAAYYSIQPWVDAKKASAS